jgi:plastocyanin
VSLRPAAARAAAAAAACALCLSGAVALGATGHGSSHGANVTARHGSSHAANATARHHPSSRACRRHAHRHCPAPTRHTSLARAQRRRGATSADTPTPTAPTTPSPPADNTPQQPQNTQSTPSTTPAGTPPPAQTPAAGPAHLQVSAKEFSFTLSHASAPAGRLVLELVNAGQDEHNLHIRPAAGGADVGAMPTLLPGHHEDMEFNLPPGTYTLYCGMPAHEALGMKATFTVQ